MLDQEEMKHNRYEESNLKTLYLLFTLISIDEEILYNLIRLIINFIKIQKNITLERNGIENESNI